ncbi:hypothetical protein HaLaN_21246, partial [Haematococcus lacustris]
MTMIVAHTGRGGGGAVPAVPPACGRWPRALGRVMSWRWLKYSWCTAYIHTCTQASASAVAVDSKVSCQSQQGGGHFKMSEPPSRAFETSWAAAQLGLVANAHQAHEDNDAKTNEQRLPYTALSVVGALWLALSLLHSLPPSAGLRQ